MKPRSLIASASIFAFVLACSRSEPEPPTDTAAITTPPEANQVPLAVGFDQTKHRESTARPLTDEFLLAAVKSAKASARGIDPKKMPREYVTKFDTSFRSAVAQEVGTELPALEVDPRSSADQMYMNLATMVQQDLGLDTYRGDAKAAQRRREAVALTLPTGEQCTGIIIARNAIATAGHCATGLPRFIRIGNSAATGGTQVAIRPEDFRHVALLDGRQLDMAVIVHSTNIPGIGDTDLPVFANASMIDAAKELQIVGFGGSTANHADTGVKRLGKVPMASPACLRPTDASDFRCVPGFEIVAGARPVVDRLSCPNANATILQQGACAGDSGGPVYVEGPGNQLFLAGVIRAIHDPQRCGCAEATNLYVRLDKQIAFLRSLPGINFHPNAFSQLP